MFHRARDGGADGPDFQETLARLERELDAEWDFAEMRSPHFQIAFAGGERESDAAARAVSDGLEDAYFHVGGKLDLYPDERVPVVLYPSEDFHDVTQTPSWTGGVYDGRIKLPSRGVEQGDSAVIERTLRHEYGHVLVSQLSRGRAPVWLNEGVAIWCEEERDGDREDWAYRTLAGQVPLSAARAGRVVHPAAARSRPRRLRAELSRRAPPGGGLRRPPRARAARGARRGRGPSTKRFRASTRAAWPGSRADFVDELTNG